MRKNNKQSADEQTEKISKATYPIQTIYKQYRKSEG